MNRALRAATVGVLLLSPVVLSACSAGQVSQTASQVRDKTGAMGDVGSITLRAVRLAYPPDGVYEAGSNAQLELVIANSDQTDDRLIAISGDGFSGVVFGQAVPAPGQSTPPGASGETEGADPSAGTQLGTALPTLPSGSATPSETSAAPTTGSQSASDAGPDDAVNPGPSTTASAATPSGLTTSSSTPQATTSVDVPVPAGQNLLIGVEGGTPCTLVGLSQEVTAAQSLPITFRFQRAGEVTVQAPLLGPAEVLPVPTPFDFHGDTSNDVDVAGGAGEG